MRAIDGCAQKTAYSGAHLMSGRVVVVGMRMRLVGFNSRMFFGDARAVYPKKAVLGQMRTSSAYTVFTYSFRVFGFSGFIF